MGGGREIDGGALKAQLMFNFSTEQLTSAIGDLYGLNVQLLRSTGTGRVDHQEDQVTVRDFLHAERPLAA